MPKLSEIPMKDMMEALPKISTNHPDEPLTFNLTIEEWESQKDVVHRPDWYMKFDDAGNIECGEGHLEDENAIAFIIKKENGYQTLLGMYVHGLNDGSMQCAQMSMMMGKIGIPMERIKEVQSFFKRVKVGLDPIKEAMAEANIEVDGE